MNTGIKLFIVLVVFSFTVTSFGQATNHHDQSRQGGDPNWSELIASMDKMHRAMDAVARSGNGDIDFIPLDAAAPSSGN